MSAKQSNRKPAGTRKESEASAQEGRERKRSAKRKGLKAGSRQQVGQQKSKPTSKQITDPHLGSRKPVALIVEEKTAKSPPPTGVKEKKRAMTPEQELASIENDERLNALLDRLDAGETLDAADQAWADQRVDRYQELMNELGIVDNDDEESLLSDVDEVDFDEPSKPASEEELWERFTVDYQPDSTAKSKKK